MSMHRLHVVGGKSKRLSCRHKGAIWWRKRNYCEVRASLVSMCAAAAEATAYSCLDWVREIAALKERWMDKRIDRQIERKEKG